MKKRKVFLALLLAFVLLFTMVISVACEDIDDPNQGNNQGDNQGGDTSNPEVGSWALQKISISGSYKTEYQLNDAFSADGLAVTATLMNVKTKATRTEDVTAKASVDSSRFNSAMVGAYVITISCTHESVTRYADYSVKVLPYEPAINGISMTKTTLDYDIPSGHLTVSVNLDDITVKAINANGEEETTPLAADAYTLSFFKGGQKIDSMENVARGSYTIQAERKSDGQKAFVVVDVTGGIGGITASTTQEAIELANDDATAVINVQDITVKTDGGNVVVPNATTGPCIAIDYKLYFVVDGTETELENLTVGAGKYKVKVTATYQIAANNTVDFTAEVTITVKVKTGDDPQPISYKLSADDFEQVTLSAETTWLATDDDGNGVSITATSSKTVVIDVNSKSLDGNSFTQRVKLGGAGNVTERSVKITVTEKTTITIYAMSSSNKDPANDPRTVKLLNSSGSDVDLNTIATLDGTTFTADTKVDGAGLHKIVITVEAGTYYFCSASGGLNVYGINLEIGQA